MVLCGALIGLLAALALALGDRIMTFITRIPFGPCIAPAFWAPAFWAPTFWPVWSHGALADGLIQLVGRL